MFTLAIAVLGLAACSAPAETGGTGTATESSPASSNVNDRGNVVKAIGETAAFGSNTIDTSAVKFKVMDIQPFECTRTDFGSGNGHMIAVTIDVETGKDLAEQTGSDLVSFNSQLWKGYAADGTRMNTVSSNKVYNCVNDQSALLPDLGPAEKASGIVLLDCPDIPSSLAFGFPQQGNSWEWEYSQK